MNLAIPPEVLINAVRHCTKALAVHKNEPNIKGLNHDETMLVVGLTFGIAMGHVLQDYKMPESLMLAANHTNLLEIARSMIAKGVLEAKSFTLAPEREAYAFN